jgi:hypothetical protein
VERRKNEQRIVSLSMKRQVGSQKSEKGASNRNLGPANTSQQNMKFFGNGRGSLNPAACTINPQKPEIMRGSFVEELKCRVSKNYDVYASTKNQANMEKRRKSQLCESFMNSILNNQKNPKKPKKGIDQNSSMILHKTSANQNYLNFLVDQENPENPPRANFFNKRKESMPVPTTINPNTGANSKRGPAPTQEDLAMTDKNAKIFKLNILNNNVNKIQMHHHKQRKDSILFNSKGLPNNIKDHPTAADHKKKKFVDKKRHSIAD